MSNQQPFSPKFVTPEEIEYAVRVLTEFQRLVGHRLWVSGNRVKEAYRKAARDYESDPTDSRFEKLMNADMRETHFRESQRLRSVTHEVLTKYAHTEIVPWLKRLLTRGAQKARESFERVIAEEKERTIALTGFFVESQSPVVAVARKPLDELELMIRQLADAEESRGLNAIQAAGLLKRLGDYLIEESRADS